MTCSKKWKEEGEKIVGKTKSFKIKTIPPPKNTKRPFQRGDQLQKGKSSFLREPRREITHEKKMEREVGGRKSHPQFFLFPPPLFSPLASLARVRGKNGEDPREKRRIREGTAWGRQTYQFARKVT